MMIIIHRNSITQISSSRK